jgi:diguanylate cyclase (GGDEF)-like protein
MEGENMAPEDLIREIQLLRAQIAELKKAAAAHGHAEGDLRALSHVDEATGLYNRGTFFTLALQQLRIANRVKKPVLLLRCRVGRASGSDEEAGAEEASKTLAEAARVLRETFRESDVLARVGADEFALLVVDAGPELGPGLAARMADAFEAAQAQQEGPRELAMEVGVACWDPEDPCTVKQLLDRAGEQMCADESTGCHDNG